jgi:hypothetical protein
MVMHVARTHERCFPLDDSEGTKTLSFARIRSSKQSGGDLSYWGRQAVMHQTLISAVRVHLITRLLEGGLEHPQRSEHQVCLTGDRLL